MHRADLHHDDKSLQDKLERIFQLRRTKTTVNWDSSLYNSLLEKFGNPHKSLPPVIHVAGTNGKGSIIAMLRSILEVQGLKVHCYTSPHLINVNERIYLAGEQIEDSYLEELIDQALDYINDAPLSFFEITTAIAFKAFSQISADILLLEVGMGGRLDCTNVIENPLATVINRISLDHTEFLGETLEEIAAEKAGIMKRGVPCIIGYQGDEGSNMLNMLQQKTQQYKSVSICYGKDWSVERKNQGMEFSYGGEKNIFPIPALVGEHQILNAGVALAVLSSIKDKISISNEAIEQGLKSVQWAGRLQRLDDINGNEIWLDSGHNDSAGMALAKQIKLWKQENNKAVHLVVAMLKTKDIWAYLSPLLPHIDGLHLVPIKSDPNSWKLSDMQEFSDNIQEHESAEDAMNSIACNTRIVVCGSVYLVGEVLSFIKRLE